MKKIKFTALLMSIVLVFGSCNSSKTVQGGAIGAGGGAALGAIIGGIAGKGKGAAIGAAVGTAVGGTAGAIIGNNMDKKAQRAAAIEGAEVEQITDNNGLSAVKVTFNSGILFGFNSATLNETSKSSLREFSKILKEDPTTDVDIIGHTDKVGTYEANLTVSNRRAQSVSDYLLSCGVSRSQIQNVRGVAYDQYDEHVSAEQNRRVEIFLYASEQMIKNAQSQAGN